MPVGKAGSALRRALFDFWYKQGGDSNGHTPNVRIRFLCCVLDLHGTGWKMPTRCKKSRGSKTPGFLRYGLPFFLMRIQIRSQAGGDFVKKMSGFSGIDLLFQEKGRKISKNSGRPLFEGFERCF